MMEKNRYEYVLEAMGYLVLDFREFGDYQGEWAALVRTPKGVGIVRNQFGSCSGCDDYEGHFRDWSGSAKETPENLKAFGEAQGYVPEYDLKKFQAKDTWDSNSTELLDWVTVRYLELVYA